MLADDGLPISEVGEWALEKHERLRRYVDITSAVRRKFIVGAGATYIDLYCGPGRSRIRETGALIEGSPVVAPRTAVARGAPFNTVFIADRDRAYADAAHARLGALGLSSQRFAGPAERTVDEIVPLLNPQGLHFAFLDPFNLADLPFALIEKLAKLQRMDLLIHVSVQDLQRNLRLYIDTPDGPLDRVAPGWRDVVDVRERDEKVRALLLDHWLALIRSLNMAPSKGIELVSGQRNQRLYWLVLIARHELAGEFWDKIRNITPQGRLDL